MAGELDELMDTLKYDPFPVRPWTPYGRARRKKGVPAKKTQCKRGHPLSGDNLYVTPKGVRVCRTCDKLRHAEHRKRKETQND